MIAIERGAPPPGLDETSTRDQYGHRSVILALHDMQHGKCCYCEALIPESGLGKHVEHFRPRSKYGALRNSWSNLLLACPQCNGAKSDIFPVVFDVCERPVLLNPSVPEDDPEVHLRFGVDDASDELGLVLPRNGSKRGAETIMATEIYRADCVEKRRGILISLRAMYELWLMDYYAAKASRRLGNLSSRHDLLMATTRSSSECAAVCREFTRSKDIEGRYEAVCRECEGQPGGK